MGVFLRTQNTSSEYFLGGRTLGWKPLSLSIMATQLSAVSFVSAPAFVGLREGGGLVWLSYELALPLAMLFLLWRLLPTLHQAGVVSIYDYLEQRFDGTTRLIISVVFQISRAFATAIMIYTLSIILQGTLGMAVSTSILLIGVITLVYSTMGGMKAVVYGDALQMLLIVLGAFTCAAFAIVHLGGIEAFISSISPQRIQTIRWGEHGLNGADFGVLPMLFGGFVLYASYYGCDQSEAQRALSAQNLQDQKRMMLAAAFMRFPVTLVYCIAGLAIGALALSDPAFGTQIPPDKPDWMMPLFITHYLPNGVMGLLFVAIMAAAMSSLSSAINSLAAVSVEDVKRVTGQRHDEKKYTSVARLAAVFWGVLTLVLSFFVGDFAPTVIEAINKIGSLFYGPVLATFLLGVSFSRIHARHATAALLVGLGCNAYLWLWVEQVFWFWWNLTGFTVTFLCALMLSYLLAGVAEDKSAPTPHVLTSTNIAAICLWSCLIIGICLIIPAFLATQ